MSKDVSEQRGVREPQEWEHDPYNPRHYTGENGPPLKPRGSKRQGRLLMIGAVGMVVFFAFLARIDPILYWYYLTLKLGLAILAIAAGGRVDVDVRDLINKVPIWAPGSPPPASRSSQTMPRQQSNQVQDSRASENSSPARPKPAPTLSKSSSHPDRAAATSSSIMKRRSEAIADEAARHHVKVAAHAHLTRGIKAAVRAGVASVASVEHGSMLDDEAIKLMIEHHTAPVPTMYLPSHYLAHRDRFPFDEPRWQPLEDLRGRMMPNFHKALAAGVLIVMGSDAVAGLHGQNAKEIEWMVKAGMTPARAIRRYSVVVGQGELHRPAEAIVGVDGHL